MKTALIFGITGQDGAYLTNFLLKKGYSVHGVKRRNSNLSSANRLDYFYKDPLHEQTDLHLHYGDITDASNVTNIINDVKPDEIYNLSAQSHVAVSFVIPIYTAQVDAVGTANVLEAIRSLKLDESIRFYQASTSELYGSVLEVPQNEKTPFNPQSPYSIAKLYSFWMTKLYREAYKMHSSNGILFNHESPLRGENFVTRKITIALSKISIGSQKKLSLGNLDSLRDWGHAKDYVEAMWKILQQDKPKDYVISSGEQISVRDFVTRAAKEVNIEISWKGEGLNEKGFDQNNNEIVNVSEKYFRPAEVSTLLGDSSLAEKELNWKPKVKIDDLISEMMKSDIHFAKTGTYPNHFE
ncbi:MAG: GDP-mannose 4,6-dehydratase [Gammaproteobacteria bacterium]